MHIVESDFASCFQAFHADLIGANEIAEFVLRFPTALGEPSIHCLVLASQHWRLQSTTGLSATPRSQRFSSGLRGALCEVHIGVFCPLHARPRQQVTPSLFVEDDAVAAVYFSPDLVRPNVRCAVNSDEWLAVAHTWLTVPFDS